LKAKWLLGEMAIRRNGNKPIIILIKPYRWIIVLSIK
jgi:hypothetical protein